MQSLNLGRAGQNRFEAKAPGQHTRQSLGSNALKADLLSLRGAPFRGKKIDVLWSGSEKSAAEGSAKPGLTVRVNGKEILRRADFKPGDALIKIDLKK